MTEASKQFFDSLASFSDLQELIQNGEAENLYLECKSPAAPQLNKDMRFKLAASLSGFSNAAGGVVIWGISTTKHDQSGLDVLTQIEPVGNLHNFAKQIAKAVPTLTTPAITATDIKTLHQKPGETRGVVLLHIPQHFGDPIRSNQDDQFYFRNGDEFTHAPYDLLKRLFGATQTPDLLIEFHDKLIKLRPDGTWEIPIVVSNDSNAVAEKTLITLRVKNPEACESIQLPAFREISHINPGSKMYMMDYPTILHRGLMMVVDTLQVKMKVQKRPKRNLKLELTVYANNMRARRKDVCIQLAKKGFSVTQSKTDFPY